MNARQKAKKYKKLAEAYKKLLKGEVFKPNVKINIKNGTIETIKVVRLWDDRFPDEFIKNEISKEFGKFCLENNLIYLEVDKNYDELTMCRKITGTMKVCKDWWENEE